MRCARLAVLLPLAACAGGRERAAPAYAGPAPVDAHYDAVGRASWYGPGFEGRPTASGARFDAAAPSAAHRTLPLGSVAEVTSLDTGRTILVLVNDRGPGDASRLIDLSRGAARALGVEGGAPVRVRSVIASPPDLAALRAGHPAAERLNAPPVLLAALRRKLDLTPVRAVASPSATRRYLVQVAAFARRDKAEAAAAAIGGHAEPAGALFRVRLGPFATAAEAQRARDGAVRAGYGSAKLVSP